MQLFCSWKIRYLPLAFLGLSLLPTTEAAAATAPDTAPVAVSATFRIIRRAMEGCSTADFTGFAVLLADALAATVGFTDLGADLPKAFLPSLEAVADFAGAALVFADVVFFAFVAITLILLARRA